MILSNDIGPADIPETHFESVELQDRGAALHPAYKGKGTRDPKTSRLTKLSLRKELALGLENKELNHKEAINILLKAVFANHKAEPRFQVSLKMEFCGAEIAQLIEENWQDIDPELWQFIPNHYLPKDLRSKSETFRPAEEICDAFIDTDHFRIHYSTDPEQQVPNYPDLSSVYSLAEYLEEAYRVHQDRLGMDPPISDGTRGGGEDLIDCYFYNLLANGLFGHAVREDSDAGSCPNAHSGYIGVSTDFGYYGFDFDEQLKRTSAHELHHLMQYVLDPNETKWMKESTARRTEAIVWPEVANPRGIENWLTNSYLPIWAESYHYREYAPHFWVFLEENLGNEIVGAVWHRCCDDNWLNAIESEIIERGSDFNNMLVQFSIWNAITGERNDGHHYPDGASYPMVSLHAQHDEFPVIFATVPEAKLAQETGSNYIRFCGPATNNTLVISLDGHPEMTPYRRISFVASKGNSHTEWTLGPNPNGSFLTKIKDWGLYDNITMVVTNLAGSEEHQEHWGYCYRAEEVAAEETSDYSEHLISCTPNPFRNLTEINFDVLQDTDNTRLEVYDMRGTRVKQLINRPLYSGQHRVMWDGKDQDGKALSSGLYFIRLESKDHNETLKVVFVK